MSVHAYHPGTGHSAVMTEAQLSHMRVAGWMAKAEHDEQEAARVAAAEASAAAAAKSASAKEK